MTKQRASLAAHREKSGMSQYAVAKALGIPRSTYGQVELGERPLRIEMAAALAKLFGCTIDELFYGDNGPDSSPDDPGGEARE